MMVLSQDGRYYLPFDGTVFEIVPVGKDTLIYAGVPGDDKAWPGWIR